MKKEIFFLFFLWSSSLFAQVPGYSMSSPQSSSQALQSTGVTAATPDQALLGNPGFLSFQNSHNATFSYKYGNFPLLGSGYYHNRNGKNGFGFSLKPYSERFTDERQLSYVSSFFFTNRVTEKLAFSVGIGPSLAYRIPEYGSASLSPNIFLAFKSGSTQIGLGAESPGSFRFESYLGSDILRERLPERIQLGWKEEWGSKFFSNLEIQKVFWERAYFKRNDRENKVEGYNGTDGISVRFGLGLKITKEISFLTGFGSQMVPNGNGSMWNLARSWSLGVVGEILPSLVGNGIFGSVFYQRLYLDSLYRESQAGFQLTKFLASEEEEPRTPNSK